MLRGIFILVVLLLALALAGAGGWLYWQSLQPKENPYDPIIANVARNEGIDPFLVRALIWRESRFDPTQHGSADERGLMQVKPDVGQEWAKANKVEDFKADDLYEPETNIRVGTWYLKRAIGRWTQTDDPVTFALAEYNAGRKNALKWVDPIAPQSHAAFVERITFPSTRLYIEKIESMRDQYRQQFATNRWYLQKTPPASPATKIP